MGEPKEKCEHGFLQIDNQILDLLLCDTKLNAYGVLILAKVREYQRKKVKCFISNITFAKMYKTSESMIKRQITELYELGLIESLVVFNDGARGKLRLLRIPRNYTKVLNKILQTKEYLSENFKGQNSTLNTILTLEAMDEDENFKGQFLGSNFDFDPRTDTTFKGQIEGSNPTTFKGHSDPITIDTLQSPTNNKLLEGDNKVLQPSTYAPSPASSTDDFWNATDSDRVSIPGVIDDTNFDLYLGDTCGDNLDNNEGDNSDMENPNKPKRQPNRTYDEMTSWYLTQLNPISRYKYEYNYHDGAINFAWGERDRKDNQKDYYTVDQIIEYFSKEDNLDYLKKIGYTDYLKEINYPHMWLFGM